MRPFIFLFLCTAFLFSCGRVNVARYRAYPDLASVADKFNHTFRFSSGKQCYFTLAKKPKGWYVIKMDSKTIKPIADELFWSASSNSYERISMDFFNSTDRNEWMFDMKSQMRGQDYNFDHSIYFGYDGWEDDVMGELGSGKNLNDTLLESLARAYGSKCMNLTRNEKAAVAQRSDKISDSQLEDFCKYGKKDLEVYQQLLEMNPDYETIVGKVKTKLSNEYMFLWSELKQSGRDKEAEQFLPDGLYDDLMINFSKNVLNSAAKNGIIFTNGDNDTYPLWYVQQKLGVRKDLAVINTSLINIPAWVFSARNTYGFELQIPDKFYEDSVSDILYLQDERKDIVSMTAVKEGIDNSDPSFFEKASDNTTMLVLPFKNIRLSYAFMGNDSTGPVVHLQSSYIYKSDLVIMDIISSNLGKRPIYFAETAVYGTITDGIKNNLCFNGMLAEIIPGENKGTILDDKYYDLALYSGNMLNTYNFGLDKLKSLEVEQIAINYIYNFHSLCQLYLQKGDTLKAAEAAETCLHKIPINLFSDATAPFLTGDDLCHSGKTEDGHKLLTLSFERIKARYAKEKDRYEINVYSSILNSTIADAEKFGFKELIQPATNLKTEVDAKAELLSNKSDQH